LNEKSHGPFVKRVGNFLFVHFRGRATSRREFCAARYNMADNC
jgi:hypothetical protein